MARFFTLSSSGSVVEVQDVREWAEWWHVEGDRILAQDQVGRLLITTRFLGVMSGSDVKPRLFETRIETRFGAYNIERSETFKQALALQGNKVALARLARKRPARRPRRSRRLGAMAVTYRLWSAAEKEELETRLEARQTYPAIAKALGRTPGAVEIKRKKLGLPAPTRDNCVSISRLGHLFGLSEETGYLWAERRWFGASHRVSYGRVKVVDWERVLDFVDDPTHWHEWEPDRITDPELRSYAIEVRGGLRFVTVAEAAKALYLSQQEVLYRIKIGALRAVRRRGGRNARCGCWMIRSDWLDEAKSYVPRRPMSQQRFTEDEIAFLAAWRPYQAIPTLAAALDRPPAVVRVKCTRLGLQGPAAERARPPRGAKLVAAAEEETTAPVGPAEWGGIAFDPAHRIARFGSQGIKLTGRETQLFEVVFSARGAVVPVARIAERIFGDRSDRACHSVRLLLFQTRKKLGEFGGLLRVEKGVGYWLARMEES